MNNFLFIRNVFCNRAACTLIVLALFALAAPYLSGDIHRLLYTISINIKDLLMLTMPLILFFFIASTLKNFGAKAPLFVLAVVLFESISNFLSVWYSYFGSVGFFKLFHLSLIQADASSGLSPFVRLFQINSKLWTPDKGVIAGAIFGIMSAYIKDKKCIDFIERGFSIMIFFASNIFPKILPLFLLGFASQMYESNSINLAIQNYASLIIVIILAICIYISFIFTLSAGFNVARATKYLFNLMHPGVIAFTSGCSLSTMPFTIAGCAKNLEDPKFAQIVIPATTNIQQIGDAIAQSFICYALYLSFNGVAPDLWMWFKFSCIFVLARFMVAAVLGGAIFIMIPIYEAYLNFSPQMIAILLALNVILDPLITSSNVVLNGGLCKIFETVWMKLSMRRHSLQ